RRFSFLAFVAGVALPPMMPWFFFGLRRPSEIYALSLHDALPIYSDRRDLRERAWRLWTARGDMGGEHDNNEIIREILALRAERAKLLGYETHAHWRLENAMARTPERTLELMEAVWGPAVARVREEVADMLEVVRAEGKDH